MTNRKDLQIIGKKTSINLKKTFALYGVPEKKGQRRGIHSKRVQRILQIKEHRD